MHTLGFNATITDLLTDLADGDVYHVTEQSQKAASDLHAGNRAGPRQCQLTPWHTTKPLQIMSLKEMF